MELVGGGRAGGGKQEEEGKYVRYSPEQLDVLEKVYSHCPKPTSLRRHQLIRDSPVLSNIHPKQIKVWFQNRRCREKQRNESCRLQTLNKKLSAINKLLMDENDRLQRHLSLLLYQNGYMRHHLHHHTTPTTAGKSCESAVLVGGKQQKNPRAPHPHWDADNPEILLAIAEEAVAEFLSKATGTAINWVQLIGMKPGPDSIGIVAVSPNRSGVAARACGLVSIDPLKVVGVLKDRISWFRDCRCYDILSVIPLRNGSTAELVYMQMYAPTTLASPRDFWMLRYTVGLDDGGIVVCERSVTSAMSGKTGPGPGSFVRAEMLPSGFLVRPSEGGGSIVHIVDHVDLDAWSVPEVLRPLYESSTALAHRSTLSALRHVRQISRDAGGEIRYGGGRQPAVLRTFGRRLCRGFNDIVNGFADDGWSLVGSDGAEDVTLIVNTSSRRLPGPVRPTGGVLCAKASMLLQNVPSAVLIQFLREHRTEWADYGVEAYSAASLLKPSPYTIPSIRPGVGPGGVLTTQAILPLDHAVELEEVLEVVRLEGQPVLAGDPNLARDVFLLQLCSGVEEDAAGACAQLVFAPIDESFADDAPLLPSGFRVTPLDTPPDGLSADRTADLAPSAGAEPGEGTSSGEAEPGGRGLRSVLTIAFQFTFESGLRDEVATMARRYVRAVVASVQRVATAVTPSRQNAANRRPKPASGAPEAATLARWMFRSYRVHTGGEMFQAKPPSSGEVLLKQLWHHLDAVTCCTLKNNAAPAFSFANQAGLDLLETTLVGLQELTLDRVLDESGRNILCFEFSRIMQQGFAELPGGRAVSSMGRAVSYERAVAWTVLDDGGSVHCLALLFSNWSFL